MTTPRLIETWLPIAALGEESVRERRSMTALPPIYYLHVWWARRPLVASRAALLASLLPADADHETFLHVLGIHGDPVASRRRIDLARRKGERFEGEAYSYPRAFTYNPSLKEHAWIASELSRAGVVNPRVLDPTAGGGSIPFEAVRLGIDMLANDLNPVASLVLRGTVEFPLHYGVELQRRFEELASEFVKRRDERIKPYFPAEPDPNGTATNYLWARTIRCPYCAGIIPLSPNWRLAPDGTGVRVHASTESRVCAFEIVRKAAEHSPGTVVRGDAQCPFPDCGRITDSDEAKRQAIAGTMGEQLYAIVYKHRVVKPTKSGLGREAWERGYRAPLPADDTSEMVAEFLNRKLPEWEALDIVPTERIPMDTELWNEGNTPAQYGAKQFRDLFSPRQLLSHCISVEVLREIIEEQRAAGNLSGLTAASITYLCFSLDKYLNYNSRMSVWMSTREVTANTFNRHDFAFCRSHSEMPMLLDVDGTDWTIEQTGKCISELANLVSADAPTPKGGRGKAVGSLLAPSRPTGKITITNHSGDALINVSDESLDAVVMDPPYHDNVMYAELSDYFYVWLKRTAGLVFPELFRRKLADKENEATASRAKFQGQPNARELAARDYQERMASIFAQCRRVLKPDGILTVMFTHKAAGAWDALASGLLEAGFTITASWPINTEAEGSLHIKDRAAANSTIFLVCRPRPSPPAGETRYWEDIEPLVAEAVRKRITVFEKAGIRGVDLYLSCFGPALEEFAKHWPLVRGQPRLGPPLKRGKRKTEVHTLNPYAVVPEDALDAARREVKNWKLDRLLRTTRHADMDPATEWFVLAWDAFEAPEFPYDEALRLARVVGVDLDKEVIGRLGEKSGSDVLLWDSAKRASKSSLGPPDGSRSLIDALHHAAHRGRTVGLDAAREQLTTTKADQLPAFTAALTALLEVLPVSSRFTQLAQEAGPVADAASDFDVLEQLRRLAYSDRVKDPQQLEMWAEGKS